jgi:phage-related protein
VEGLILAAPLLIEAAIELIITLANALTDPNILLSLVKCAVELVIAIVKGIIQAFPKIILAAAQLVATLIKAVLDKAVQLIEMGQRIINFVKDGIHQKIQDAKKWGSDLIQNFLDGIMAKWNALKDTVSNVANTVKGFLGFSEPEYGPLSDFHTYAPDMMNLFMQGIKDNEKALQNTVAGAFDFTDIVADAKPTVNMNVDEAESTGGNTYIINVNEQVDTADELARAIRTQSRYGLIEGVALG